MLLIRFGGARREGGTRGQSLTELALALPALLLIVLIGLDFGRAFMGYVTLQQAARIAANFASLNPAAWDSPGSAQDRQTYQDLLTHETVGVQDCILPSPFPNPIFPGNGPGDLDPKGVGRPAEVALTCDFQLITPIIAFLLPDPLTLGTSATFPIRSGQLPNLGIGTPPPAPVVCFTPQPSSGNAQLPVTLSAQWNDASHPNQCPGFPSGPTPTGFAWDFEGDSAFDTSAQITQHTYDCIVGTCVFNVTLQGYTVGAASAPVIHQVTVFSPTPAPVACFNPTSGSGVGSLAVNFDSTCTTNGPTSWSWTTNEPGGWTSTLQNPSHTFTNVGGWTVTLTASNASGPNTVSHSTYTVSAAQCRVPDYIAADTNLNTGDTVNTTTAGLPNGAIWIKWSTVTGGYGGFSGAVSYTPSPPTGSQSGKVRTQSKTPGTLWSCTSGISLDWR